MAVGVTGASGERLVSAAPSVVGVRSCNSGSGSVTTHNLLTVAVSVRALLRKTRLSSAIIRIVEVSEKPTG